MYGDCKSVCSVDCIGVNKQWHKAAVSWLAQQHRRTRQAGNPKHCSSALVYGDCKSVCSVDCIGVTKQWHKAAVSWLAQQHRRTRQAVYLNTAAVHWCLVTAHLYAESGCAKV